jgi:hypothetical protein
VLIERPRLEHHGEIETSWHNSSNLIFQLDGGLVVLSSLAFLKIHCVESFQDFTDILDVAVNKTFIILSLEIKL